MSKLSFAVAAALLVAVLLVPPMWHLPIGVLGWIILMVAVRDVSRGFGRPTRWLKLLCVFTLLGALFGQTESQMMGVSLSKAGALSGVTMVVRAFALVALVSLASSAFALRQLVGRIDSRLLRRLLGVVVIAANLVPVQLRALAVASANLKERRPGIWRLPTRVWLLALHCTTRAAMLAEEVAFDMAIAAHNSSEGREDSL